MYGYTDIVPNRVLYAGARRALKAQPEARAQRPGLDLRTGHAFAEARTRQARTEDRRAGEYE